jgi:3-oxoacyl-[acyl-carrier protein] reductase
MSRRVALVTGSAGAIGATIAARLLAENFAVAGLDVRAERLPPRTGPGGSGPLAAYPCDITREDELDLTLEAVRAELGPVAVLVNNAGVGGPFHRIDEVATSEWDWIVATNVRAPFLLCRALLPAMAEAGWGRIVNIASVQGLRGAARSSTYVTTKHALVGLTRSLALEWGGRGVTVNAVCPGYVETPMGLDPARDAGRARAELARIPAGRQAHPGEIADLVAYLAGDGAAYVNGATLVVDGGLTAG